MVRPIKKFLFQPFAFSMLAVGLLLVCTPAFSQGQQDFRNTDEYKDAWSLYQQLEGAKADRDKFDKAYAASLPPSRLDVAADRISKTPGAFYEVMAYSFKEFIGLDPNQLFSEQFFRRGVEYIPVKGYARFNQNRALLHNYHQFLFVKRLEGAAAGLQPAHERALVAIRECDDSLLAQSLREIDFVISEYEAVEQRAHEQVVQNDHQISYYDQEMIWIESPELEIRGGGPASQNIVEYLGLNVSMRELRNKGSAFYELQKDVDARKAFIQRWSDRIREVQAYVNKSLPLMRENQQKIRQAYDKRACTRCTR